MNVGRHVVFKRFLRIFCPRKWQETLCLRQKTSFKAVFYYWKTPVSNEYKPFFHLTPPSQHQENNSFRRVNCQGKLLDNGTNTPIRRLESNGKTLIFLSENVRKCMNNAAFSNIQNLFPEPVNTICFVWSEYKVNKINNYLKIYVEITVLYTI